MIFMKIRKNQKYLFSEKLLTVTNVEELPENAQFVEGELHTKTGEFVSFFVSVVADGVDTMTGARVRAVEDLKNGSKDIRKQKKPSNNSDRHTRKNISRRY